MKEKIKAFMSGRRGIDTFSKYLFWGGIILELLAVFLGRFLAGIPAFLCRFLGLMFLFISMVRAFSRDHARREAENLAFMQVLAGRKRSLAAAKDRFSQRKSYRFFRCPGCKQYLRVPKGKGKIHINCKCGYVLYRRT